jgi:hypothetical protein
MKEVIADLEMKKDYCVGQVWECEKSGNTYGERYFCGMLAAYIDAINMLNHFVPSPTPIPEG